MPRFLAAVMPGRRTPWVAVLVTTALSVLLALTGEIATLASTLVVLLLVVFGSVNLAVLVLRKDQVAQPHHRVPVVLPVLGNLSCLLLATQVDAATWRLALPLLVVGALLSLLAGRSRAATE